MKGFMLATCAVLLQPAPLAQARSTRNSYRMVERNAPAEKA